MNKEVWKDIKGYEKLYQVSNLGRVKSLPKFHRTNKFYSSIGYMSKEKILKPLKQSCNYLQVDLCDVNGKRRKKYIHKLVAEAFIPNPNNYEYVNHKDEKKTNNKIDNLEWCSFDYNLNYGTRNTRIKISHLKRNIDQLKQENQQLKENNMSMQEEMARTWEKADLYKEVIEEVREYTNDKLFDDYTYCSYEDLKQNINEILDKAKENK